MLRFIPSTPVRFYAKTSVYVPGIGQDSVWSVVGLLYCEWRGTHGERVTAAQALGVGDFATVRTFYHPEIYAKLRSAQMVLAKNGGHVLKDGVPDANNPDIYELWGGVDNVAEENRFMEFKVRRYEGK